MKFDEILEIDGKKLNKKYIESLSKQERLDLIDPIFNLLRTSEFIYPDDENKIIKSWKRLEEYVPDIDAIDLFNNSSLATDICKHFCHTFYNATALREVCGALPFNVDEGVERTVNWMRADRQRVAA